MIYPPGNTVAAGVRTANGRPTGTRRPFPAVGTPLGRPYNEKHRRTNGF